MATVNFSVPSEVKEAFDKAFKGENKSAVLSGLMRHAVEEHKKTSRRSKAIAQLLELRNTSKPITSSVIRATRRKGRP